MARVAVSLYPSVCLSFPLSLSVLSISQSPLSLPRCLSVFPSVCLSVLSISLSPLSLPHFLWHATLIFYALKLTFRKSKSPVTISYNPVAPIKHDHWNPPCHSADSPIQQHHSSTFCSYRQPSPLCSELYRHDIPVCVCVCLSLTKLSYSLCKWTRDHWKQYDMELPMWREELEK